MASQYPDRIQPLVDAVLSTPGDSETGTRRAVEAYAARLGGRPVDEAAGQVPAELTRYIEKVALHAYKVTDGDIEVLRQAGYSEDAIFEITLSAALGAGLARLERGLAALKGENNASQKR